MTPCTLSSKEIIQRLYYRACRRGVFISAPNIFLCCGESDFIEVTQHGYIYEYEVKTSLADYRADFKKTVWAKSGRIPKHDLLSGKCSDPTICLPRRFHFVIPHQLEQQVDTLPYAGLIVVNEFGVFKPRVKAPLLKQAAKITEAQRAQILESLVHKFWRLYNERPN